MGQGVGGGVAVVAGVWVDRGVTGVREGVGFGRGGAIVGANGRPVGVGLGSAAAAATVGSPYLAEVGRPVWHRLRIRIRAIRTPCI